MRRQNRLMIAPAIAGCKRLSDGAPTLADNPDAGRCGWFEHRAIRVREHAGNRETDPRRGCGQLVGSISPLTSFVLTVSA